VVIGPWLDTSKEKRNNKNIFKRLKRSFLLKKLFNKYIKDGDNSILEVYCDNVNRDEIKGLLALLEKITFKYISVDVDVDAKSIKAIKEANNREIYQARKKLEKEGFSWSGK